MRVANIIRGVENPEEKVLSSEIFEMLDKIKQICTAYTDDEQKCGKDCPFCIYNEIEGFTYCILRSIKPKNYEFK